MRGDGTIPLIKAEYLRNEAYRFFEWCPFRLSRLLEELSTQAKGEYQRGRLHPDLISAVELTWRTNLRTSVPWEDHSDAIKRALPKQEDYSAYMSCPISELDKLPKRILNAVNREDRKKAKENYARFLATSGPERLRTYLRIWQSQSIALTKLITDAWGYKRKPKGGASVGPIEIDLDRMMLSEAEATGSAMKVSRLLPFIRSLWDDEKTILVSNGSANVHPTATDWGPGFERKVVPNPDKSEERLNRFLIKLGRALEATNKRRSLPDWSHIDKTIQMIVQGWCESIIVDNRRWPPLCSLSTPALAKFLSLCDPPYWKVHQNERSLERQISRLGLLRIPEGRIKHVTKKGNDIVFSDSATRR